MSEYTKEFYDDVATETLAGARTIIPQLKRWFGIMSVIDVGCGTGVWLAEFLRQDVKNIRGIDGPWVQERGMMINTAQLDIQDLSRGVRIDRQYDLLMSIEVLEHLPSGIGEKMIKQFCAHAPYILFSAAVPFQLGIDHVNCQWPEYWAAEFKKHGFRACDCFRKELWDDEHLPYWYKQNLLLYIREDRLETLPKELNDHLTDKPRRLVHPKNYEYVGKAYNGLMQKDASRRYHLKKLWRHS